MNDLEYLFDDPEEEIVLEGLQPGEPYSAVALLTQTEECNMETLQTVLETLTENRITLDISALPKVAGTGETAQRLRLEEQLVKNGGLPEALAETDPLRLYMEEIAALPVMGDPQALAMKLEDKEGPGAYRLADLMFSHVIELAKEYVGRGVLLMDLIQEASMGLWRSIQSFEDGDFLEYCDWWLRQYLAEAVIVQAKVSGVGEKLCQAVKDYRTVDERLLTELGRNPTPEEMAEGLHMTVEETAAVAEMLENARALQRAKQPEQSALPEEEEQAVEDTVYFQMRQRISELLSVLSPEDAQLLTLRYGLEGGLPMDAAQVGARLGITEEQVNNREAAALSKLRQND